MITVNISSCACRLSTKLPSVHFGSSPADSAVTWYRLGILQQTSGTDSEDYRSMRAFVDQGPPLVIRVAGQ